VIIWKITLTTRVPGCSKRASAAQWVWQATAIPMSTNEIGRVERMMPKYCSFNGGHEKNKLVEELKRKLG